MSPLSEAELPYRSLVESQRRFVKRGGTRSHAFRRQQLERLARLIEAEESRIAAALHADLGKASFEAYSSESGFCLAEIRHVLRNLDLWMRPEAVPSPLTLFPATSRVERDPLGSVLVIAPWNFPFQLVVAPWIAALAAGNAAVLKPAEQAPQTSALLAELLGASFPPELVKVVEGGPETSQALLREKFDHILFTGGATIARQVAEAAAKTLTPLTLELGGKNPCFVDEKCDWPLAARRIAWAKFMNAGQTCIAPDFVLVPAARRDEMVERVAHELVRFFGDDPGASPDYGRIVNQRHFDRLLSLLEHGRIAVGGASERDRLYLSPTVLVDAPLTSPPLEEEIFGPILPIVPYQNLDEAVEIAGRHPDPLALYVFSAREDVATRILEAVPSGTAAVNDLLLQFMNPRLPFGGRGKSGTGQYHGRFGFELLSHRRAIVEGSTLLDIPLRYPPYRGKLRWLKKLLR